MPVIYIDNYRGFRETYIPLKNVNFLVGENSTGKTSILKLIRLLTDFNFWFNFDFNNEDAELGYFSEIASFSNPDRKDFIIGVLGDETGIFSSISAVKMKFISKDGIPHLKEVNFVENEINVHVIIEFNKIKYRYNKIPIEQIKEENILKYFKLWIKNSGLKNKTFKPIIFDDNLPLHSFYQIQTIVLDDLKIKRNRGIRMPLFIREIAWLAPIRTEPRRTYDRYNTNFKPDGTHSPYLLKSLLTKTQNKTIAKRVESILSKFGLDSGLFDKITISPFGKSETAPFEVLVSLEDYPIKITSVGYGVSQILPLIIEIISRPPNTWFAIQQPEIHLHPRGQAAFGDILFKSFEKEKKCFIIETHSDFIIDRFRFRINNSQETKVNSQVLFFNRKDGINNLYCIPIEEDGAYSEDQPAEFRNFFIKEQINILRI